MPDFALTLPEHDLTAQEFKELARRIGRAAFVPLFLRFYERVITSEATIEEQRKALADISRWTGVEEDKKVDANANLPVFNIIFGQAGAGQRREGVEGMAGHASIEVVEMPVEVLPQTPTLPASEEALIDSAVTLIPADMLASFAGHMKEVADGQETRGLAPAPVSGALVPPDGKPKRRRARKSKDGEAQGLPAANGAGHPPEDAVPAQLGDQDVAQVGGAVQHEVTGRNFQSFDEALASLDDALGL